MTDRQPTYPGRYAVSITAAELTKFLNGQPCKMTLARDDAAVVEGTPLNTATLLSASTVSALGLTVDNPTPNDALANLAARVAALEARQNITMTVSGDTLTLNG